MTSHWLSTDQEQWQQRSTCTQEEQIAQGVKALDPAFGKEPPGLEGTLTTYKEFDASFQTYRPETKKYSGQAPSLPGHWVGLYESLADAILGKGELKVKASEARDVLRIIELARESHEKGVTIAWK
jgi:predicted dehydrogenase